MSSKRNEKTSISSDFVNLNQEPLILRHKAQVKETKEWMNHFKGKKYIVLFHNFSVTESFRLQKTSNIIRIKADPHLTVASFGLWQIVIKSPQNLLFS